MLAREISVATGVVRISVNEGHTYLPGVAYASGSWDGLVWTMPSHPERFLQGG